MYQAVLYASVHGTSYADDHQTSNAGQDARVLVAKWSGRISSCNSVVILVVCRKEGNQLIIVVTVSATSTNVGTYSVLFV